MITLIAICIVLSALLLVFLAFYFMFNLHVLLNLNKWLFYPFMWCVGLFISIAPIHIGIAFGGLIGVGLLIGGRIFCKLKQAAVQRGDVLEV